MASDLDALRTAVRVSPHDATARGALADYLDDNGDPLGAALQRVLASPDDDARRLEYADACERVGRVASATFVREQIARTVPVRNVPLTHLITLEPVVGPEPHRYATNLSATPGVADVAYPDGTTFTFVRGFVEHVTCPGDWWVRHADAVTEAHPVRRVRLTTLPGIESRHDRARRQQVFWIRGRTDLCHIVSDKEIQLLRNMADVRSGMWRVPLLGMLRAGWPQIEFELSRQPQSFSGSPIRFDPESVRTAGRAADLVREHAEREARAEAVRVEAIIRAVADHYGIADPEAAARDRRLVRVEAGDRPHYTVMCDCQMPGLRESLTSPSPEMCFRTVTLTREEYAWDDNRIRYRVHRGRCACGRVYVSVRRRPTPVEGP